MLMPSPIFLVTIIPSPISLVIVVPATVTMLIVIFDLRIAVVIIVMTSSPAASGFRLVVFASVMLSLTVAGI